MAIDEADSPGSGKVDGGPEREFEPGEAPVVAGRYSWLDFYADHGDDEALDALREAMATDGDRSTPTRADFDRAELDPDAVLGFDPTGVEGVLEAAAGNAAHIAGYLEALRAGETPVVKGWYSWEDYKHEYFYDEEGNPPTDSEGTPEEFDPAAELGFDPQFTENRLAGGSDAAEQLSELVDRRTVDVSDEVDEDEFFSTDRGVTTIVNRYDLEKEVPLSKKGHFREVERYWVNKPYSFVIIFHSTKENEKKYYLIQPHMNVIEDDLQEYLTGKLRASIKYSEEGSAAADEENRRQVIEDEALSLLDRYDLYDRPGGNETLDAVADRLGVEPEDSGMTARVLRAFGWEGHRLSTDGLEGIAARPEPAVVAEDPETLSDYEVEKLLYYLKRDFIGYERIDGIKHDINVEDISCDGYNSPVFVYHSDYEQIITNIYHGEEELDDFVVKLAQRSGKGISKRSPQVDATLPDGSRAQLTLGKEVSDHGTNYTIRQFKDVPFTPIDLINWKTFSLEEMGFLWLCIENNKSLIFAGGTASGKTTSLNAVSLFIPSNSKIVSIEDTREVELPQRNWVASVTRPSFSDDEKGDIDEFDLLEAALRQRPDYIVMGEVRGEEGRTLFQVMSTGHTTYTTFHADSVGEVLKRFTTDPINVSKTMFTALDLVSIQTQTRVGGHKVRRNKNLTEINHYDAENDEINVQDVYQWQAETDQYLKMGESNTLEEIQFDRGWNQRKLDDEIFKRQAVLAYLIDRGLNTYTQVAATFQAFINDPETILTLMANDGLEASLEDLREMESVLIDIDPEKEEMVPRPDAGEEQLAEAQSILEEAEERLFDEYRGEDAGGIAAALMVDSQPDVTAEGGPTTELDGIADQTDQDGASASEDGDSSATAASPDDSSATAESPDESGATADGSDESTPGPTQTPTGADSVPGSSDEGADGGDEADDAETQASDESTGGSPESADPGGPGGDVDVDDGGEFSAPQRDFATGPASDPDPTGGDNPFAGSIEDGDFVIGTSDDPVTIGRLDDEGSDAADDGNDDVGGDGSDDVGSDDSPGDPTTDSQGDEETGDDGAETEVGEDDETATDVGEDDGAETDADDPAAEGVDAEEPPGDAEEPPGDADESADDRESAEGDADDQESAEDDADESPDDQESADESADDWAFGEVEGADEDE